MSTQNQHNIYAHEYMKTGSTGADNNQETSNQIMNLSTPETYQVNPLYQQTFQVKNRNFITEHSVCQLQQAYDNQNEFYPIDDYSQTIPPTHNGISLHLNETCSSPMAPQGQYQNFSVPILLTSTRNNNFQAFPISKQRISKSSSIIASPSSSTSSISDKRRNLRSSMTSMDHHPEASKPKIATTFWEDENTTCYQVEARGILVSRREDSNFINGTKLLNVIGMTRGKRDGILKSEKKKKVIKVGSMNLKGVWIPFERAAEIARNEGVDNEELLGPLFVKDIATYFKTKGYKLKSDSSVKNSTFTENIEF